MTDEQKQRKLEANRAYRERQRLKKSQNPATIVADKPTPQEELALRIAQANGIDVPPPNSKEKAEAVLADSTARAEYVQLLFSPYAKSTNLPQLLQGLIREQIETRVVLIDLLAEILKGVQK